MPLPLWATIVGISLAKKITVLIAAKLYGIPRLYRYALNQRLAARLYLPQSSSVRCSGISFYLQEITESRQVHYILPLHIAGMTEIILVCEAESVQSRSSELQVVQVLNK